jgi:hypothetical protein
VTPVQRWLPSRSEFNPLNNVLRKMKHAGDTLISTNVLGCPSDPIILDRKETERRITRDLANANNRPLQRIVDSRITSSEKG